MTPDVVDYVSPNFRFLGGPGITVVSGPPCAGKSTYIREHAEPGDILIDFDVIAVAFGSPTTHGHEPMFLAVTTAACRAAIDVCLHTGLDRRAWIIDAALHPMRKRIYTEVGARFVALTADLPELHRRATTAGRKPEWHSLIDGWAARSHGRRP